MEPVNHWKQPKFLQGPVENVREAHPWADLLASKNQKKDIRKVPFPAWGLTGLWAIFHPWSLLLYQLYRTILKKTGKRWEAIPLATKKACHLFWGALTIGWQHRKAHGAFAMEKMSDTQIHLKALVVRGCPKRRASWKFTNSMEV